MYILVTYDVDTTKKEGANRLRNVARICMDYGQRVQNSVFECEITEAQLCTLKNMIHKVIDENKDSVRIYYLSRNNARRVEILGKETAYNVDDAIII